MRQESTVVEVRTQGRGLFSFHRKVEDWVRQLRATQGLLTLVIQHTSASLLLQENADPDVQTDLDRWLSRLVQDGDPLFQHTAEGPDDMPSHVRAALTLPSLSIPVAGGRLVLGTWQGLYVFEHRLRGHARKVALHFIGE